MPAIKNAAEIAATPSAFKELDVDIDSVTVLSVTGPRRIAQLAQDKSCSPLDVYVKVRFSTEDGKEYEGANKLSILGKDAYQKFLDARVSGEKVNVSLHIYRNRTTGNVEAFVYLNDAPKASIDDLFANAESTSKKTSSLTDLIG
ncbi:hypothetical protein [Paratractidigestivibacter sp.]|uniref:hypothetical protein n=1 Tax=Paratractidigestivibacter sp. TaxID=2847316 RepID=UPI002AC96635|nr:hypothetical protein [Paratractidigestivibacter sp.]